VPSCCRQRAVPVVEAILICCMLAFAGMAQGGTFQVNPIRITLSPQSTSALLSIQNDGAETARFQIGVFEWDQAVDGEMVLNPTEDLIFYPKLIAIDPGDQRNIRVGTKQAAVVTEKSYRIFVEELPPADNVQQKGIRLLTKMGIPVFIQPTKQLVQAQLGQMKMGADGFSFEIKNTGNVHFFPGKIRVLGKDTPGEILLDRQLQPWYVLSGGVRKYSVEISPRECHQLHDLTVELEVEGKTFKQEFSVPTQVCQS
jgi:fimbrial chaperone protein